MLDSKPLIQRKNSELVILQLGEMDFYQKYRTVDRLEVAAVEDELGEDAHVAVGVRRLAVEKIPQVFFVSRYS